jgi:GlpG protein
LVELPALAMRAPLTALACAICIGVFAGLWSTGDPETWQHLARWGAPRAELVWSGSVWALLTTCFVHVEVLHFAFNVYWLWLLGRALEREIPAPAYAALFVSAGITSSAAQLAVSGDTGIGMSGVLYALFGFMWLARPRYPRFAEVLDARTIRWLLLWLVGCFVATRAGLWNIANAAHVAGLAFGAGVALARGETRWRRAALTGTALVSVASLGFAFWCPWNADWTMWRAMGAHGRGEFEAAERWYRRSLEQGQSPPWVWSNLGDLLLAAGDEAGYRAALEELRRLDAEQAEALVASAERRESLRASLDGTSDPLEQALMEAALAELDRNWGRAEDGYREVLAANPGDYRAADGLAGLWVWRVEAPSSAQLREALELAEQAAALTSRQDVDVLDTLAEAWFLNGDARKADETAREWQALLSRRGDSRPTYYHERAEKYRAASGR